MVKELSMPALPDESKLLRNFSLSGLGGALPLYDRARGRLPEL